MIPPTRTPTPDYDTGFATPEARWARLGPYYAMFPISFAKDAIDQYTHPDDLVIDPFCGRGTTPYAAMVANRDALACEINPVGWVYAATKTAPAPNPETVKTRVAEIAETATLEDHEPRSEFQTLAFCPSVLGFLHAARRELRWRSNIIDRTVVAFILHYLHTKIPQGLSNQMRHSRAMSPDYCVRWWNNNGYETPPSVDPVDFLNTKIDWRYKKGIPQNAHSGNVAVILGDSTIDMKPTDKPARLVITSPPYSAVTNYKADSWLRLWALGEGPALPRWDTKQKYVNLSAYETMIRQVFTATAANTHPDAAWLIRCDARSRTLDVVHPILAEVVEGRTITMNPAPFLRPTQTSLYGDQTKKPGEMDLLVPPSK